MRYGLIMDSNKNTIGEGFKWFTEPSGLFVIKIPVEWQYSNVAAGIEESPPFSFQTYQDPKYAFQISCYTEEQLKPNMKVSNQKSDTNNLKFEEFRLDGKGFNVHVWGATVDNHSFIAKYIYKTEEQDLKEVKKGLALSIDALKSLQLLSKKHRKLAFDLDKYEKFMSALGASFDVKMKALERDAFIEVIIITANQIDAYLRLAIVLSDQLKSKSEHFEVKYFYQGKGDKPITERQVYKYAFENRIIDKKQFDDLEELYKRRNEVVHRYIISELRTREIMHISYKYELICEKIRLVLREFEKEQYQKGIGIHGTKHNPHGNISESTISFYHSQINDKHLLKELERSIKGDNKAEK
ncbi:MAG: hypothetical protein RIE58_01350 [Vicingaceae bacterium]